MNVPSRTLDPGSGPSIAAPDGAGVLRRLRLGFLILAPILFVTILAALLPPDGNERADWMQFVGRFHPLLVHFPIALFLLVPVLEIGGRNPRFSYLRLSVSLVLTLATLTTITAAILGWCLGRAGGYSGTLVTQHMWGGISLLFVCWLCWLLRTRLRASGVSYRIALALGAGLVAWTGYRGGQLSLGPNHLTEHMPNGLRSLLRIEGKSETSNSRTDPNTFYGARIQPIFTAHCINCHGTSKQKGKLRLDNYRALMRGGKDGPVIQTGSIQTSDLFRRITLPASHDDFMPKGKQPLTADQLKAIELWIGAGASDTLAVDAIKNAPLGSAALAEVKFEQIDTGVVAKLRSALAPTVSDLQQHFPNILDYDSRGSADLRLNASILGSRFGDRDLEAFAPIAQHIVVADLSHTAVTDRSATAIAAMKRLRVLRLTDTHVTDATVLRLDSLNELESLNVYGTPVTAAVLPAIASLPKLSHFYAGQTGIPPAGSVPEGLVGKVIF